MRIVKLPKAKLFPFLEIITEKTDLWAPVKKYSDKHVFKGVKDFSHYAIDPTRPLMQSLFIPADEEMIPVSPELFL